jgi:hypothetical protein
MLLRLVPVDFGALDSDVEIAQATCTADGRFVFLGVPPGEYTIRIDRAPTAVSAVFFADTAVAVGDQDVSGLSVPLRAGLRVRGRVRYDSSTPATPARFSVYIESADGTAPPNLRLQTTQLDSQGGFVTSGRRPGRYLLRVMLSQGSSQRWFFKGAMLGGRDVSIVPLELRDADVDDVVLTFSEKPNAEIAGLVTGVNGPDASASVIVFPVDRERWTNTGSRPRTLRLVGTDSSGRYRVSDLPPGEYFVASAGTPSSSWSDPTALQTLARMATRVQLADGEKKVQELRVR